MNRLGILRIGGFCVAVTLINIVWQPLRLSPRIHTEVAQSSSASIVLTAQGFIEPRVVATVRAESAGNVESKNFREGDSVAAGRRLLKISSSRRPRSSAAQQETLDRARADLVDAMKDLRMQRALHERQAVPASSVEAAEQTLVRANQGVSQAEAALRRGQSRTTESFVVAPFQGIVTHDILGDRKTVTAGSPVAVVGDLKQWVVRARFSRGDLGKLNPGQSAEVRLSAFPDEMFTAEVSSIDRAQEAPVELRLGGTRGKSWPSKTNAEVRIHSEKGETHLTVPVSAIATIKQRSYVWVVDANNRLHRAPVTLGRRSENRVEITSGLQGRQRFSSVASPIFSEGKRVRVRSQTTGGFASVLRRVLTRWRNRLSS